MARNGKKFSNLPKDVQDAIGAHKVKLSSAFERARKGETIDLTDLMISQEQTQDKIDAAVRKKSKDIGRLVTG